MTKETFNLVKDLLSLNSIMNEYMDNHWVSFYGASVKEQPIHSDMLRNDFKKFVNTEINKILEELDSHIDET